MLREAIFVLGAISSGFAMVAWALAFLRLINIGADEVVINILLVAIVLSLNSIHIFKKEIQYMNDNYLLNESDKHMNEEMDFDDVIHAIGEEKPIADINTSLGLYELLKLVLGEDELKNLMKDACSMYADEITEYQGEIE